MGAIELAAFQKRLSSRPVWRSMAGAAVSCARLNVSVAGINLETEKNLFDAAHGIYPTPRRPMATSKFTPSLCDCNNDAKLPVGLAPLMRSNQGELHQVGMLPVQPSRCWTAGHLCVVFHSNMSADGTKSKALKHPKRCPLPDMPVMAAAGMPRVGAKRGRPTAAASGVPMTHVELQQNYRRRRRSASIDLPAEVMAELRRLHEKTGETNAALILRALHQLDAYLKCPAENIGRAPAQVPASPTSEHGGVHHAATSQNTPKSVATAQQQPKRERQVNVAIAQEKGRTSPDPVLPEKRAPYRKKATGQAGTQPPASIEQSGAPPSGDAKTQVPTRAQPTPVRNDKTPTGQLDLFLALASIAVTVP